MIERPMKNLSLRKFRVQIGDLTTPVEVSVRDAGGNIRVLGYWTPYLQYPTDAKPPSGTSDPPIPGVRVLLHHDIPIPKPIDIPVDEEPGPKLVRSPDEVAALVPANPVRAVPKPGKRSNR